MRLNQHEEFLDDEFEDLVEIASIIIGVDCADTLQVGDIGKGDNKTKYQIMPDPHSVSGDVARQDIIAFNAYFLKNYGKWKGRCYFDTPSKAFSALIKAWTLWNGAALETK